MGISKIFRDRQAKPLETATWWVEHLLEHKVTKEVLHSYAVDLNWFVFYSLDAVCILVGLLFAFVWITKSMLKMILCRGGRKKYDKLKQN